MRIIDRYVIRQILMPFCIGLIVFTFVFIIRTLMDFVEPLIAKGISAWVLVRVLALLVPQALALSIPMSLLLGILVAFGRLSSQREFVALQACGVSLRRLLLPVGLVSICGWAATSYVMLVAVPESNQSFRNLTWQVMAERAEGEVTPRVFYDDFPGFMLFVRDVPITGGGWNGVFLADTRTRPQEVYLAQHGEVVFDQTAQTAELRLEEGVQYTQDGPQSKIFRFSRMDIRINFTSRLGPNGVAKTEREMTIAELRADIAERLKIRTSTHNQLMAIHQKFAIPVACLVFGVIGLALGATNRRDSALGSFGLGIAVVFAYYIPLFLFPQMTKGGYLPPWLAVWLPNILLGLFALVLFIRRDRLADQPFGLPAWVRRLQERAARPRANLRLTAPAAGRVLDYYVTSSFVRVLALTFAAALAVFYISTFIDLSDKLFKDNSRWVAILEYFVYATPQFAYYILPLSILIATLVTVGMLTASSELVAMKACGVSLYRATVPMLVCAAIVGGLLFALDATVLGQANRHAERVKDQIKDKTNRIKPHEPWTRGDDGRVYSVGALVRIPPQLHEIDVWTMDPGMSRLIRQTHAQRATPVAGASDSPAAWRLENGWTREFDDAGQRGDYREFASAVETLESAAVLSEEPPDAEFMSFRELRQHTARLASSGFDVLEYRVDLARKLAFPFVTVIMTLIAIPFAVTIGRSGTMAGIGVGVALALFYWGTISISVAFGYGGALAPVLAAWAPNLLFATGAAYLILTVRT